MSEKPTRYKRARLFKEDPCILPGFGVVFPLDTCPQDLTIFKSVARPTCTHATEESGTAASGCQRQQLFPDIDEGLTAEGESRKMLPSNTFTSSSRDGPFVGGCVEGSDLNSRGADQHNVNETSPALPSCERQDPSTATHALGDELEEDVNHSLQVSPSIISTPRLCGAETCSSLARQARATEQSVLAVKASEQRSPTTAQVGGTVGTSITNALSNNCSPMRSTEVAAAVSSGRGELVLVASDGEKIGCSRQGTLPQLTAAASDQQSSTLNSGGEEDLSINGASGKREQQHQHPLMTTPPPAVSMIVSFFKQPVVGTPSPVSDDKRLSSAASSPTIPMSLASLVSGVPGSGGGRGRDYCTPPGGRACGPSSSIVGRRAAALGPVRKSPVFRRAADGRSRFCNEEWPTRVKERRRILRFPSRGEPPGTRILYWVRGSFRVRDNLALSVAMWLSRELQMPLQALTFVDPTIGRAATLSCPSDKEHQPRKQHVSPSTHGYDTATPLPFRMAVESSALCEMEQALRALNIPLTALSCAEGEIPSALALWCNNPNAKKPMETAVRTSPQEAAAAGRVHIAITNECYHPRHLWLAELAAKALPSVALYTVDSCSCCPINTFHGRRTANPSAGGSVASKEELRRAQDGVLKTVCTELVYRPRLPLEARLQTPVFLGGIGGRAAVPPGFAVDSVRSSMPAYASLDWGILRSLSAQRFPGFGKPFAPSDRSSTTNPSTQDFIALMGGGERAADEVLRQTLEFAFALGASESKPKGAGEAINNGNLQNEISGVGFGGALLHLLRVGSISSLYVVQALLGRSRDESAHRQGVTTRSNAWARLLDSVLNREYFLYRSYFYYQTQGRAYVSATTASNDHITSRPNLWKVKDWQHLIPSWVNEELQKGQRDMRQHPYTPEEIKRAGSTVPSSVEDPLFSAIQVRLMHWGRLHPILGPYWARGILGMMLLPSQAVALVITLAEDLCLGAAHAGDVVPELLADAFDAFKPNVVPSPPSGIVPPSSSGGSALCTGSGMTQPIFRGLSVPPISSRDSLESALGGAEALARFMSPVSILHDRQQLREC